MRTRDMNMVINITIGSVVSMINGVPIIWDG